LVQTKPRLANRRPAAPWVDNQGGEGQGRGAAERIVS